MSEVLPPASDAQSAERSAGLPMRIDVVSDAICPWCWIGRANLAGALEELGWDVEVHWHPYQLNPDMPREGVARAEYRAKKFGSLARSAELDAQVTAAGAAAGLDFRFDRQARTPNTILAHRLARFAGAAQDALIETMFRAYFQEGEDIGDPDVLTALAARHGLDAGAFLAGDEYDAETRAEDANFRRIGINGVPSFALGGHILFSGAMPPAQMAAAFRQGRAILQDKGLL
jgi:predicted DsbA family dithiol-disulfide isomerase